MFLLLIFLSVISIGLIMRFVFGKKTVIQKTDELTIRDYGRFMLLIGIVFGSISLIINFNNYSNQLKIFEDVRGIKKKINILNHRYNYLYATFNEHLSNEYPSIEKEIFNKISPSSSPNLNIIFANYPQLKSSFTLCKLVDETKIIADDMYNQELKAQELYIKIRYNKENPWIIIKAKIPDDIIRDIY